MTKRKHRVVVEVTMADSCSEKDACNAISLRLEEGRKKQSTHYLRHVIIKTTPKAFSRVMQAERRKTDDQNKA